MQDKFTTRQEEALQYGLSEPQLSQIGVPYLHQQGLNGTGIRILVIDSGFDILHEAFENMNIVYQYDFINNINGTVANQIWDDSGQVTHGTHVLSILGKKPY